jgi:hypothetical protein
MNGSIQVPAGYRHMLREGKVKKTTEEYKPIIRRLIESRAGEIIRQSDFKEALGVQTAAVHLKKLEKAGYVTKTRIRHGHGKGNHFQYQWNTIPLSRERAAIANGEVVTRHLNLPDYPLTKDDLDNLHNLAVEWFDDQQPSAEQMAGVLIFRKWARDKFNAVDKARREIINGDHDNSDVSNNSGLHGAAES